MSAKHRSVRAWLADETRQAHEALHHHPRLAPLADGSLARAELAHVLAHHFAIYEAVERARASNGWCDDLSLEAPIQALVSDLLSLSPAEACSCRYQHGLTSEAQCLGALYVLMGSQFGGQIIGRALSASFPDFQSSFFAASPERLTAWRLLLKRLETFDEDSDERADVLAGAQRTFTGFGTFMLTPLAA